MNKIKRVYLSLTKACNQRCLYCHQGLNKVLLSEFRVPPKTVASYFDEDDDLQIMFYGGEPFLLFDYLIELVYAIKERSPNIKFSIITNGSLLDKNKVNLINSLGIGLGISHDGPFQEEIRRTKDFLKTDPELILMLKKFSFGSVFNRKHYNFYEFWDYFDEFDQKWSVRTKVYLQSIKNNGGYLTDDLLIKDMPEFEQMLDKVFSKLKSDLLKLDFDTREVKQYISVINRFNKHVNEELPISAFCGADTRVTHMDTYGNFYPCHNLTKPNGHISNNNCLSPGGYNSRLRSEKCMNCKVYILCGGGCIASNDIENETVCYIQYQEGIRLLNMLEELRKEQFLYDNQNNI